MSERNYDIAIIGAGPAGSAAAYFLAKGGLKVALLDKTDFPRDKTCGDGLTPRAVKILDELGALDKVAAHAYRCKSITLRQSDAVTYQLSLAGLAGLPNYVLVLPRYSLDDLLLRHAIDSGAHFKPDSKVENVTREPDGSVLVRIAGREPVLCSLAIVATGANTKLLRDTGLLTAKVPINLAARGYFENVEGLDDSVVLFFDEIDLPGYGWVFPTSPTTANIGCGVFFDSPTPQPTALREMIQSHPYLKRILKNAKQSGPIKGYPLRTDFSPSHSGNEWILVVGESAGLVNPITGEGIDYALESASLAAQAILNQWDGGPSPVIARNYRAALSKKFRYQLMLNHLAQKVYFRDGMMDNFLRRGQHKEYLRQAIVDACFGSADPMVMFSPRILWEVFGP
ncbi:MAG TPA: geranylgeranyl reductase family protein [Anaerolineales bacterium]|nr:geranylgeranyl reductase family protein [Anaerolineales bacterium]